MATQKRRHLPRLKNITDRWTDRERLVVVQKISSEIEEEFMKSSGKSDFANILVCVLEDWKSRLDSLVKSTNNDLERDRYDVVNGNPAKYQ